jgi:hypothetical protein
MAANPIASSAGELSLPFAGVLQKHRVLVNGLANEAINRFARLEPADVQRVLTEFVQPVVLAMLSCRPSGGETLPNEASLDAESIAADAIAVVVGSALSAAGFRLLGFVPSVNRLWTYLLPQLGPLLVEEPHLAGQLTNACAGVMKSSQMGAVDQWLGLLETVKPFAKSAASFRTLGVIAAWRCGMAAYRETALGLCDSSPDAAIRIILSIPPGTETSVALQRYKASRWFVPETHLGQPIRKIGAFRGLGGAFFTPPAISRVESAGGDPAGSSLVVSSGDDQWVLVVDGFGSTLQRVPEAKSTLAGLIDIGVQGAIADVVVSRIQELLSSGQFDSLGPVTSAVEWDGKVLFTTSGSYSIRCTAA